MALFSETYVGRYACRAPSQLDPHRRLQEPDLYSTHGQRPNLKNYTTDDYIGVRISLLNKVLIVHAY